MSLMIDTNEVVEVLIDKWYKVKGNTFDVDAFEIGYKDSDLKARTYRLIYQPTNDDSSGFIFIDRNSEVIMGPMSSIKALKIKESK